MFVTAPRADAQGLWLHGAGAGAGAVYVGFVVHTYGPQTSALFSEPPQVLVQTHQLVDGAGAGAGAGAGGARTGSGPVTAGAGAGAGAGEVA